MKPNHAWGLIGWALLAASAAAQDAPPVLNAPESPSAPAPSAILPSPATPESEAPAAATVPDAAQAEPLPLPAPDTTPAAMEAEAHYGAVSADVKASIAVKLPDYVSMMFTPSQLDAMEPLIKSYRQALKEGKQPASPASPGEAPLAAQPSQPGQKTVSYYTYPQFFLKSILYYGPARWTVWVNDERITQDSPKEGAELSVAAVSSREVTFTWRPPSETKIRWNASKEGRIALEPQERLVHFTLHPNQTFSSYGMNIVEGRVQPASVDASLPDEPQALPAPQPAAQPLPLPAGAPRRAILPPAAPSGEGQPEVGLESLMNRYRHLSPPGN